MATLRFPLKSRRPTGNINTYPALEAYVQGMHFDDAPVGGLVFGSVLVGGVWNDITEGYVLVGGAWKAINSWSVLVGGTWKTQ